MKGESKITDSLYAGLQLILPGEVAPSHRHTQSALRFVMHGDGAYTSVDGEKTTMHPGDFVITPSWTWHDHGNESDKPMIWLDGLDIPIVKQLGSSFSEKLKQKKQTISKPEGDSLARYGSGLLPINSESLNKTSPIFSYPYIRTREALEKMKNTKKWSFEAHFWPPFARHFRTGCRCGRCFFPVFFGVPVGRALLGILVPNRLQNRALWESF